MKEQLEKIKEEALKQIEASDALDRLNEIRVAYLGKKGELTNVLKSMKNVAPEDRPKVGQMVNEVREIIETRLEESKNSLAKKVREEQMKKEVIDVTLPAKKQNMGHLQRLTAVPFIPLFHGSPLLFQRSGEQGRSPLRRPAGPPRPTAANAGPGPRR